MSQIVEKENYDHKLYKHVKNVKDADAVAYAFVTSTKGVFFPYKQPSLKPDELRANILYTGLCASDMHTVMWGPYLQGMVYFPLAPGHEIIAEVSEVGSDVKKFKKGDKVAFGPNRKSCQKCKNCQNNKEQLCTFEPGVLDNEKLTYGYHWGGWSTQIQQPADYFLTLPSNIKLELASPLVCAGITTYRPIVNYARPGLNLAVCGIGGLGHMAIQLIHKMGMRVDALTTSSGKEKFIKDLGATNVVVMSDKNALAKVMGKYDVIFNTSNDVQAMETLIPLCTRGSSIVQISIPSIAEKTGVVLGLMVMNEVKIITSLTGSRREIEEMLEFCADNNVYPITEFFDFEDSPKAHDKLHNGKPLFRCVVNCVDYAKKNGLFK